MTEVLSIRFNFFFNFLLLNPIVVFISRCINPNLLDNFGPFCIIFPHCALQVDLDVYLFNVSLYGFQFKHGNFKWLWFLLLWRLNSSDKTSNFTYCIITLVLVESWLQCVITNTIVEAVFI